MSFTFSICRHVRTIPRRGRQTLCHQYQSEDIRNETLIKILNAKTSNQLRHLLDKFGEKSLTSIVDSPTRTSSSSRSDFGEPVNSASAFAALFVTPSPSSELFSEKSHRHCLHKRTPSPNRSKAIDQIVADNRTKNHSSDGNDVSANCINTSDDIDWYIQLASKCYTDGFLSHVKHLDECTRPRSAIPIDTKSQRHHIKTHPTHSSSLQSSPLPSSSSVCQRQRPHRIRRPLKPLRSTNLFSSLSRAVQSAANVRGASGDATNSNWCDSFKICDSHRQSHRRCNRTSGTGGVAYADDTMNRGVAIDTNSIQGLQHQLEQPTSDRSTIDDQNNRFVYADDRMNISSTTANCVNDLINSFYTLNLSAADDISLPQIILTDFSNNSLQPTTTPLFLSTTENRSSTTTYLPAVIPNVDDDNASTASSPLLPPSPSSHHQFVVDDFQLPETKSQLQFTFNDAHFSSSPNYCPFNSNGSRSFNPN